MGLLAKLRNLLVKEPETTETGPKGDRLTTFSSPWTRFYDRKNLWNDIQTMDRDETIIATALNFIARFSTQFTDGTPQTGFVIEGPDDELEILDPLALLLQGNAFEHVRYMTKFGDLFAENVVDSDLNLVNVKMFPYSYQVNKNVDKFGRLRTGDPVEVMRMRAVDTAAYDQVDDNGSLLAAFHPYQIAHFSFGNKQGLQYTEPMLAPVISPCKRLRSMEDGLAIARITRAYQTRVHKIPVPMGSTEDEIKKKIAQYAENMTRDTTVPYDTSVGDFKVSSRQAPLAVTDFYEARMFAGDGKTVDGDVTNLPADSANLENLEDIYLLLRRVLCGTGVPADFLNLSVGQRAFVDKTSAEKREAFLYLCQAVQMAYHLGVRGLCELQMLLHGRMPWETSYRIVQPRISPREAETAAKIDLTRANTALLWTNMGVPYEIVGPKVLQMTPAEVQKWVASGGKVVPAGQDPEKTTEAWVEWAQKQFTDGAEPMPLPVGRGPENAIVAVR